MDQTKKEHIVILLRAIMPDFPPQFIGAPKVLNGIGMAIKNVMIEYLIRYNLVNHDKINIIGMGFDTTASNTGHTKGAATLLEKEIN